MKIIAGLCTIIAVASLMGCARTTSGDMGMVAGGVLGGVAGSALTGGSTVGTVAGAVGGAYVGKELAE